MPRGRSPRVGSGRGSRFVLVAAVMAVVAASVLVSCGSRNEFEDRRAVVEIDGRSHTFTLDAKTCGLDGETAFLVGHATDGMVLQAVIGVERRDHERGVPAASGLTVGLASEDVGAFGSEAWERRGKGGDAPGRIDSARIRGARLQMAGSMVRLDAGGDPRPGEAELPFTLDARCDAPDG